MIRCIAIDKDDTAIQYLSDMISRTQELTLLKAYPTLTAAVAEIEAQIITADLIFLDMQTGAFDPAMFGREFPAYTSVILTTIHPQYNLQGCQIDIIDHLIKPFSLKRFKRSIRKFNSYLEQSISDVVPRSVQLLTPDTDDYIFIRHADRIIRIWLYDIYYVEEIDASVTIQTSAGKIVVLEKLEKFKEVLRPYKFVAISATILVSVKYIDVVGNGAVVLENHTLDIKAPYTDALTRFLE